MDVNAVAGDLLRLLSPDGAQQTACSSEYRLRATVSLVLSCQVVMF